jgi:hypothetical protein
MDDTAMSPATSSSLSPMPPGGSAAALDLQLSSGHRETLERAIARWSSRFGWASMAELKAKAIAMLATLTPTPPISGAEPAESPPTASLQTIVTEAERLCMQLERAHEARFGRAALKAERDDDIALECAQSSGDALFAYQQKWERTLARLQRAHPRRWRVAGLSDEEVRDALTLRLLELIVVSAGGEHARGRPGKPWGLCVAQTELSALRRSFRLAATPTDFDATPALECGPNQEDRWLELEADQRRAVAGERAKRRLNQPQRTWLAAMQHAAAEGEFFASSDQLNLSAASRKLGKNRSSAQRAYRALQACFQRELGQNE